MKLTQELEGKKVKIISVDGELFTGTVSDYIYPEDNEPEGIAAIDVYNSPQRPGQWLGFNEDEIRAIEVIK